MGVIGLESMICDERIALSWTEQPPGLLAVLRLRVVGRLPAGAGAEAGRREEPREVRGKPPRRGLPVV